MCIGVIRKANSSAIPSLLLVRTLMVGHLDLLG